VKQGKFPDVQRAMWPSGAAKYCFGSFSREKEYPNAFDHGLWQQSDHQD
jgi:hypothetical protein